VHVKSIRVKWDIDQESLAFCTILRVSLLVVHAIRSNPLASIGNTFLAGQSFTERKLCAEMLIALRGPWVHALKADWEMLDPIMVLKPDCP
jgi:hypothetical protein